MFILLFTLLILLPFYEAADSYDFTECSKKEYGCGGQNYEIYYPFRLPDSPEFCGLPGFQVTCNDANMTLLANFEGKDYTVKDIDYSNRTIQVIDPLFLTDSCPGKLANYTLDPSLVRYSSDDVNVTVFVNCSSTMQKSPVLHNISCLLATETGNSSFYVMPGDTPSADVWKKCSTVATIPIYLDMGINLDSGDILTALQAGFSLQWEVGDWCNLCTDSGGLCWFDRSSPDAMSCYCSNFTSIGGKCVQTAYKSKSRNMKTVVLASSLGGTIAFLAACFGALCYYKGRKKRQQLLFRSTSQISSLQTHNSDVSKNKDLNIEGFLEKYGSLYPKRYKYSDVKRMTGSFHHKLGQGAYGSVFRGTLSDGGVVAVKVLSNSKGNGDDFVNEIASIGRSSHVNVVNLVGFCSEGTKRALLYEYMCNGSLDKLICLEKQKPTPDWEKLYRIATGIARGIEYLHRGCNTKIVHFDIKPHNILLDQDFCPKISDFGLAMLCHRKDSILSMEGMRGTMGYIAPEVFSRNFGVVSSKSDIYSYGMMMLEMAGGRKKVRESVQSNSDDYFPGWIYKRLEQDEDVVGVYGANSETENVVRKMLLIGLWCIQTFPQNRPSITKVIEMLEGSISDLHLPPKPCLSFPPTSGSLTDVVVPVHDSCCSSEVP